MTVERLQGVSLADGQTLKRYWQTTPVILEQALDVSTLVPDTETLTQIMTATDLPSRLLTGVEGSSFTLEHGPFESFAVPKSRGPCSSMRSSIYSQNTTRSVNL